MSIIGDSMSDDQKENNYLIFSKKPFNPHVTRKGLALTSCCAADIPVLQLMTVPLILGKSKSN